MARIPREGIVREVSSTAACDGSSSNSSPWDRRAVWVGTGVSREAACGEYACEVALVVCSFPTSDGVPRGFACFLSKSSPTCKEEEEDATEAVRDGVLFPFLVFGWLRSSLFCSTAPLSSCRRAGTEGEAHNRRTKSEDREDGGGGGGEGEETDVAVVEEEELQEAGGTVEEEVFNVVEAALVSCFTKSHMVETSYYICIWVALDH